MIGLLEPTDYSSLPLWAQITSFCLAVVLALIKIVESLQAPELKVHLTRDLFFRLIDQGEALFCKAVLLSENGPVLVRDVDVVLKRENRNRATSSAEKSFPLEVTQYGEAVRGTNNLSDHHFFGSSPLAYIAAETPQRPVYLCLQREYRSRQKRAADEFVQAIQAFGQSQGTLADNATNETKAEALNRLTNLIEKHYQDMIRLIQLESGDYELSLTVTYERSGKYLWKAKKQTSSQIRFSVSEVLLDNWRSALKNTLTLRAQQMLTKSTDSFIYPELQPDDFIESSS